MIASEINIRHAVKNFARTWRAALWPFVTKDVRNAIVDSMVMDSIRNAFAIASDVAIVPRDLIKFRNAIVIALEEHNFRIHT